MKEGSLEAPTRHPLEWRSEQFWDPDDLERELERVYDICHGCRRCVSLCEAFPTLFDLVDESETFEVDGVDKADYSKVVDQCYLCDLCYMTKCPYVPPHDWNVDFPHLMLRAKAVAFRAGGASVRDRVLSSTDRLLKAGSIPLVDVTLNTLNKLPVIRKGVESVSGIHREAPVPRFHANTLQKQAKPLLSPVKARATAETTGNVAIFPTCYGNYSTPEIGTDFIKVLQHNGVNVELVEDSLCCGMPKMELGDLDAVAARQEHNIALLAKYVDRGFDLLAPIPSCVLMFKQELPLMYPQSNEVARVQAAFFDPFEYLWLRHKGGELDCDFAQPLGEVTWQAACHQRVQNIGPRTKDVLELVPQTRVTSLERCSGHDGTYAVKVETREASLKIARPVVRKIDQQAAAHFTSDCPMAATHLAELSESTQCAEHPMTLLRKAYGLD